MTDLRTAAQQALEALEESEQHYGSDSALRDAMQILRAALEQPEPDRPTIEQMMSVIGENQRLRAELKFGSIEPEQEPVAYIHRQGNHWEVSERFLSDDEKARGWTEEPLYTHPPRREWRGLTDEIIDSVWPSPEGTNSIRAVAYAIEAKLKELNHE